MNIVLLGPPGAGRGTQSKYLEDHFKLKQLSTGDMLRHAVATGSPVGVVAKSYMEGGKLVPDDVVVGVISEAIDALPKDAAGFILDGFPRTVQQAEVFDQLFVRLGKNIDAVIVVDVKDDVLVKRISGRFTCAGCGEVFNDFFRLPKAESIATVTEPALSSAVRTTTQTQFANVWLSTINRPSPDRLLQGQGQACGDRRRTAYRGREAAYQRDPVGARQRFGNFIDIVKKGARLI